MPTEPSSLFFDENFLFLDRWNRRMLPVFPEWKQQSINLNGAGNLDFLTIQPNDVASVHSSFVSAAKRVKHRY